MRKITSIFLVLALTFSLFSISASAVSADDIRVVSESGNVVYYSDGTYTITSITAVGTLTRGYLTLNKTIHVYNEDYEETCSLTVTGNFYLSNNIVTCVSSSYSTHVYVSGWSIASPAATCGNHGSYATATATGTAKKKILGIVVKSIPLSVTITCYSDGTYY